MSLVISFFGYILLFIGLCMIVILAFAFTNIFTKSYDSKNAIAIISFISILFVVNSLLLFLSFSRFTSSVRTINAGGADFSSSSASGF